MTERPSTDIVLQAVQTLLRRIVRNARTIERGSNLDAHIGTTIALLAATRITAPGLPSADELEELANACVLRAAQTRNAHAHLDGGRAGLACALWFAAEECNVEVDEDVLAHLDDALTASVPVLAAESAMDLLHGVSGLALVGGLRKHTASGRRLTEACKRAYDARRHSTLPFFAFDKLAFGECTDYGVAHGLAGMLASLLAASSGIAGEHIANHSIIEALARAVEAWVRAGHGYRGNTFPTLTYSDGRARTAPSPLAWCYGDLGVTTALASALASVGRAPPPALLRVAADATKHLTDDPVAFAELPLCHGLGGTLTMLRRLGELCHDDALETARQRCLSKIVAQITEANLDAFESMRQELDAPSGSLFAGEAGVVLALLTEVGLLSPRWDFMLGIRMP